MRYRNMLLFLLGLGVVAVAVEAILHALHAPFSLTDRKGPGQIILFAIGIIPSLWFSRAVAGVSFIDFVRGYRRDWRRMARGFLSMFLLAAGAMLVVYIFLTAIGTTRWSQTAWNDLTPEIWGRTAIALLVVLVLATTEEMIFRAFILRYFRWSSAPSVTIAAIIASALIFSLSHLIALQQSSRDDFAPLLFGLFLLGALLGTVYVVTGSIACSIGIHAGLLGFKVFLRRTELIDYAPGGLTGGSSDLRTGPGIWLVMVLTIIAFIYWRKWLRQKFWIEAVVFDERATDNRLGFRRSEATAAGSEPAS